MRSRKALLAVAVALASAAMATGQQAARAKGSDADDPPGRVARLSSMAGAVSFKPAGLDDWSAAELNYPFHANDQIWTDKEARAELSAGNVTLRMGASTSLGFLGLDDHGAHVMVQQGTVIVRLWSLGLGDWVEVDSPNSSVTLLKPGLYRIAFDGPAETTKLVVRGSEAEVLAAGSTFRVEAKQQARITGDADNDLTYDVTEAAPADDFDRWSSERDERVANAPKGNVSPEVIGYEDLAENGTWTTAPEYGAVWRPTVVVAGWAPYRFGHWAWVAPWGWTWIDAAPWGFAPFHYGRWAFWGGAWVWAPGPIAVRPWYAPALVGFFGGGGWRASFGVGGGFAWFPLGPREPFFPFYRYGPAYLGRVNININVTAVTPGSVAYANRAVPGAVTAVSRETVTLARPVGPAAVALAPSALASARVTGSAPAAAPVPASVLGHSGSPSAVARPPAAVASRTVTTLRAPAPAAVPFAAQQSALAAHPGRPLGAPALAKIRQASGSSAAPLARSATSTSGSHGKLVPVRSGLAPAKPYGGSNASAASHVAEPHAPHAAAPTAHTKKTGKGHEPPPRKPASKPKESGHPKHPE